MRKLIVALFAIAFMMQNTQAQDVGNRLALNEYETFEVITFPNPAADIINFSFNEVQKGALELYGLDGQLKGEKKFNARTVAMKIDNLEGGIYFYRIFDHRGRLLKHGTAHIVQ